MADDSVRVPSAVREEEAFLALAETLSALIVLIQGDALIYINPAGSALLGLSPEDYKGRNFWDFAHPDDRQAMMERGRSRQRGVAQPRRYTERLLHKDGRVLWIDYSVDLIQLGGKTTILVTGHDITEAKKQEEELRKSEALFRGLYIQSPVMLCSVDPNNGLREISDYWLAKLGYERREMIGRSAMEYLLPESVQRLGAILEEKRKNQDWACKDIPLQMRRKDGSTMDILFCSTVELDRAGQPTGWIVVAQDLSEIRQTREALDRSEGRFHDLFTRTPVMMCAVDLQDHFTTVSDHWAAKLGYTREELVGKITWSITAPESTRRFQALIAQKAAARDWFIKDVPLQLIRKDGSLLDILLTCVPELGPAGDPLRWLCVAHDLSEIRQTQQALFRSEERFRAAFQGAAIGKTITDATPRFVQVNRAFCDMLGYPEAEILGKTPRDFTHPDDVQQGKDFVDGILSGGRNSDRQTKRYVRKDGRILWVDMTATLVRDEEGRPSYFVTEIQDITERKEAERLLQDTEKRFRDAFENAAIGKAITGVNMKLLQVNRAFADMLGYTREELLAKTPMEITHPDDRAENRDMVLSLLEGRTSFSRILKRYLHKDGRVVWADLTTTLVRDPDGKPVYFVTEVVDITERRRAEDLLRDREAKLIEAQRIAKLGRWEWDVEKDVVTWSEEMYKIFGITPEQFAGNYEAVFSRIHPEDRKRIAAQVANSVEDGKPHEQEYRAVWPNGEYRYVAATNQSVMDASGRVVRMFGVALDITERKRAEERIRDREARLAESQKVAHIGSWEYDIRADKFTWSEETYRIVGLEPGSYLPNKEDATRMYHPEDQARVAAIVADALEKGISYEHEARFIRKSDGQLRHVYVIGRLEKDADGKPVRLYGTTQDITDRKRADELIRDREAKLNEAQRVAKIGSWQYDIASNSSVWSDEMYRIFGTDPKTFNPSKENAYARFHADDLPQVAKIVEKCIQDGEPFEFDARLPHADGAMLHLHAIGRAIRGASGKPVALYGTLQDVTKHRQAQELLRDREAKLSDAQRIAHIGSWEWDVASNQVTWSDELFRILGLDPATATSSYDGYVRRIHADDRADLNMLVERAVQEGRDYESEHRIVRDNGETRNVWVSCRLHRDDAGRTIKLYGIVQDITERRRAQEALQTHEQRFRNLYSQAPVMMTAMDPDGRVREVSNYWLQVMGYDRDEVIGQDGFKFITADSRRRLEQALAEVLLSGERVVRNVPMVGVKKNGGTVDVLVTSVLEMTPAGQPVGAIVVGIDVSDIRRAEEAVRESEARYRALVEHAPEAIAVLDIETGKFIDINKNAETLFGLSREQLLACGPLDICPPMQPGGRRSSDVAWDAIGRVMRGEPANFEFVHRHTSGREVPTQVRLSRLPATGQNLIRATLTDISDQKTLEEKIRHAEKMAAIGLLAAGVAHEIGNPLLALSMAAQSLERRFADEYAQKKLGLIREHIDRISKIVRQMSDLARPQSVQPNSCDVNRVLERTVEIVRYDKRAKEVPIRFEPCPDIPFVRAVEDQLMQVCLNLSLNALDAVAANAPGRPKSLAIFARCVKREGRHWVRAGFKDSGPGIPEESRSKIFQPFFTTKSTGKGTGLGLSVSYKIIQEHRGTLSFDCAADGTEFYFELPVQEKS